MYTSASGKVYFNSQLKILYKLCSYLGLIHFKFDPDKKRFLQTRRRSLISTAIYRFFQYAYGYMSVGCMLQAFFFYLHLVTPYAKDTEPISVQEDIFRLSRILLRYIATFMLAISYMKHRRLLLTSINEMLRIFKMVKRFTNSSIFFYASFKKFLIFKACLIVCRVEKNILPIVVQMGISLDIFGPFSHVLCALTTVSYFYIQLVLICFYLKMTEFLKRQDKKMSRRKFISSLRSLMSISFLIYRVKRKLDRFFGSVFVATYVGLFADIQESYEVFKVIVYAKYSDEPRSLGSTYQALRLHIPVCVSYSFDMFLICRLSEVLVESEAEFCRCAMEILSREELLADRHLQQKMEMMVHQNHLFNLSTYVFGQFKMNRQFSFDCIINIISAYVISCLQFYASQAVYVAPSVGSQYSPWNAHMSKNRIIKF